MTLKIAIIGSCVTRDSFEYIDNIDITVYLSRVSLISMCSSKPNIIPEIQSNVTGFLKRTLVEDFEKKHLEVLTSNDFDYLIIDFIDERFSLRTDVNGSYITNSQYVRSHTNADISFPTIVPRLTHECLGKWISAAGYFTKQILKILPQEKIVIHEAYWVDGLKDSDRHNTYLSIYYNFLKVLMPKANYIKVSEKNIQTDPNHKWGVAPYHYKKEYYEEFAEKLIRILNI